MWPAYRRWKSKKRTIFFHWSFFFDFWYHLFSVNFFFTWIYRLEFWHENFILFGFLNKFFLSNFYTHVLFFSTIFVNLLCSVSFLDFCFVMELILHSDKVFIIFFQFAWFLCMWLVERFRPVNFHLFLYLWFCSLFFRC